MKKPVFFTELAYVFGLWMLAWGTAGMVWADFGISMVVAPAYILHLALVDVWSWFSFGIGEYVFQAILLLLMILLLRKIKLSYFLSFLSAVFYGLLLDAGLALVGRVLPADPNFTVRMIVYIVGNLFVCGGVAMMFKTYLPPEVYELFVKEVVNRTGMKLQVFKTIYDCASLVLAVVMSLLLLGKIEGVGVATLICALVNGTLIQWASKLFDKIFRFKDGFALREKFEKGSEKV